MNTPTSRSSWTYADYARLPDDGNRYEVLDGEVLVTPSPSPRHQHVLFTLAQNALEAPRQPGKQPRVEIELSGDRYAVTTSVSDDGLGIGEAARDNLFRPFFTTKANGTGLGLASSRAIIESHGGTIGFEDIASGGARFWFRLPAAAQGTANS